MSTIATILSSGANYPLIIKLLIVFLAGLLPIIFWLWFWEHEDKHPEPKKLILFAFLAGMLATVAALPFEELIYDFVRNYAEAWMFLGQNALFITLFLWASVEELLKFAAAYLIVLIRAENDEPIDSMMYMIMTALGFSALENMFFLFKPVNIGNGIEALATGDLRFVGATLLHTITSGIIGLTLALTFYRSKSARRMYVTIGVITAIVLHTFFNLSIIILNGSSPILPFYAVWVAIVVLLLAFEKVKQMKQY